MRHISFVLAALLVTPITAGAEPVGERVEIQVGKSGETSLQAALDTVVSKAATHTVIDITIPALVGESIDFKWPGKLESLEIRGTSNNTIDGKDNTSTWLTIRAARGSNTNIWIHGLTVTRYARAVVFEGSRERPENGWNGGNQISDMHFVDIGSRDGVKPATAVLDFVNSRENRVTGNTFDNIFDSVSCNRLRIVYLASYSSHNYVANNIVHSRCGAPFKLRDASDDNLFVDNQVTESGDYPVYQEDYCNSAARSDCTKHAPECPSLRNVFTAGKITVRTGDASSHFYSRTENGIPNPSCEQHK